MSDYRVPIEIKDITDDKGNQYTNLVLYGEEFAVVAWELKQDDPFPYSRYPNNRYQVWMDVRPVPKPEPKPKKPMRSVARSLGLRKPR